jgi:hypothetical protein
MLAWRHSSGRSGTTHQSPIRWTGYRGSCRRFLTVLEQRPSCQRQGLGVAENFLRGFAAVVALFAVRLDELLNGSSDFHVSCVGSLALGLWLGLSSTNSDLGTFCLRVGSRPAFCCRYSCGLLLAASSNCPVFLGFFAGRRIVTKYEPRQNGVFLAGGGSEAAISRSLRGFLGRLIASQTRPVVAEHQLRLIDANRAVSGNRGSLFAEAASCRSSASCGKMPHLLSPGGRHSESACHVKAHLYTSQPSG